MVDLLDARGYEILVKAFSEHPVTIKYLGAVKTEHPKVKYDEDPYVVSCVVGQRFTGQYSVVLKDSGIRKSGLKMLLEAEQETEVSIAACGEELGTYLVGTKGQEKILDLTRVCRKEREYLERIHRILYMLLGEVDRICRKYDLRYFLVFGGLLGSLRHGDIIPWDDDIDIAMTRNDFEQFQRIAPKELGADFGYLHCSELGGGVFLDFMCRVLYMKEEVPGNVFRKASGKCHKELENHLPLDIFILDRAFDHPWMHKFQMLLVRGVYGLGMGHRAVFSKEEYDCRDRMTQISVRVLSTFGKLLPVSFIFWLHDKVSTMNQQKETKDFFMSNGFLPFIHTRYSCKWFETSSVVQLGEMQVQAPADVEAYLKRAYYDYYHYPPVDKRIQEHSPDAKGVF